MRMSGKQWLCLLLCTICVVFGSQGMCAAAKTPASDEWVAGMSEQKGWWLTEKGMRYYKNGAYLTGLQKIGSNYYFFSPKGFMKNGTATSGKWTYYTTVKGVVDGKKKGSTYYTMKGKKLTGTRKTDYETKLRARNVVRQITNDRMSLEEKRLACFKWVSNHPYMHWRNFTQFSGWQATYANDHFQRGRGNCVSDACAFAYLAQALGYKKVYVCLDGYYDSAHCWCEVDGKVFDPLFAQMRAYGFRVSYNVSYSTYPDKGMRLHIKLP